MVVSNLLISMLPTFNNAIVDKPHGFNHHASSPVGTFIQVFLK